MAKPAGMPLPAPTPPPVPFDAMAGGLTGGVNIPPEFFDVPPQPQPITPGPDMMGPDYVPPPRPGYEGLTPFDAWPDPARTPHMMEQLRNHSIQPDGQLGYAHPVEPWGDARTVADVMSAPQSPTQRMVQSIPGENLAQPENTVQPTPPGETPYVVADAAPGPAAPPGSPTATPGRPPSVFRPEGSRNLDSDHAAQDAIVRSAQASNGLPNPWETKTTPEKLFDWDRYKFAKSAADKIAEQLSRPLPASQQPMIPSEMPRGAPAWHPSSGFRRAFNNLPGAPSPPSNMAAFLQKRYPS